MSRRPETSRRFILKPRGPFSMDPVRRMQCGFLLGTRSCGTEDAVTLAFPRDGSFDVVGVRLAWAGGRVAGEVFGTADLGGVRAQVERVLGLDQDGDAFARVLERDPVLRRSARARPGFRPVVSYSPYAMAGWCVLSQRIRMSQAAALQTRLAQAAGDVVDVDGERVASFPRPQSLLDRAGFPGVSAEKWRRFQAVARAALEGKLEPTALAAMDYEEARERLMAIDGVGAWTAEGILVRGCGTADVLPLRERALHGAVRLAYGLSRPPSDEELIDLAESWKPFRTWVSVLLISEHFEAARRAA